MVDIYKGYKFTSYIDLYRTILLDELIKSLESDDDKIVYFSRFSKSEPKEYLDKFCKGNNFIYDYEMSMKEGDKC